MAKIKVWFDREGDYLEVTFTEAKGYLHEIGDDLFERVDESGKVIGFAIFNFSKRERETVEFPLELARLATS